MGFLMIVLKVLVVLLIVLAVLFFVAATFFPLILDALLEPWQIGDDR